MLRGALAAIGRDFVAARQESFGHHPVADFLRGQASAELKAALGELSEGLLTEGSPGAGKWASVPWLAVFNPFVTTSATRGYYVVYLFSNERPEVHLSLNQGTTAVRKE